MLKYTISIAILLVSVQAQASTPDFTNCKIWFDGCNNCQVESDNTLSGCTNRVCAVYKKPFCRVAKTNLDTVFKKKMFAPEKTTKTEESGLKDNWTITSGIGPEKGLDF